MKIEKTWEAKIYVGTYCKFNSVSYHNSLLSQICQNYCDEVGFCVTVTPTEFVYTDGHESGVIVGLIQYPRFPKTEDELKNRAFELAKRLMKATDQERVSIVFPDVTVMLERDIDT